MAAPFTKRSCFDIDWTLCIICQRPGESLIERPTCQEKLLSAVHERAGYGDSFYPDLSRKLEGLTVEDLINKHLSWHRQCYQSLTSKMNIARARTRFENEISSRSGTRKSFEQSSSSGMFRRGSTDPYDNDLCFFCQGSGTKKYPLHKVATDAAGESLKEAVEKLENDSFRVRLSTAINPSDAHAIDVRYHMNCWSKHVVNVLRKTDSSESHEIAEADYAAEIEFINLIENLLSDGSILNMNSLVKTCRNIRVANGVKEPDVSKKKIKQLILERIPNVVFSKPLQANESERVSLPATKDKAIAMMEEMQERSEMEEIFSVAKRLRSLIISSDSWRFKGSLQHQDHLVPRALYIFFRWLIVGPSTVIENEETDNAVNNTAMNLAQTTMYSCLSSKQISKKVTATMQSSKEWPLQVGVGLSVHSSFRSKQIIDLLHAMCVSVSYKRILSLETQIANQVIRRMFENDGVYIPKDFVRGRHIFMAIDNCDFQEDTPDGKNTLHGTVMNIYQQVYEGDANEEIELEDDTEDQRLYDLPNSITKIETCPVSSSMKPACPVFQSLIFSDKPASFDEEAAWLLASSHDTVSARTELPEDNEAMSKPNNSVPTWSGLNSIVKAPLKLTRVGTPPLIAAPAHEWSTLMTVLKQAQRISTAIVGENKKTVISLDMGLYKPAKQILMLQTDLQDKYILRPGELHTVMAMLRTIGSFIDNSGVDSAWIQSNIYGQSTCNQIINGNHVKRGLKAHIMTLLTLFHLYKDVFFRSYPELELGLKGALDDFNDACDTKSSETIRGTHSSLVNVVTEKEIVKQMAEFDQSGKPMHKIFRTYMKMVCIMLQFIRSVRTGDWNLHLISLEAFTKYFFALDKLNYARMIPLYLAEMKDLQKSNTSLWLEFQQGNWVVNKSQLSFCALGADHALEQVNKWMKITGGLVGITQNENARTRFFLVAPEMTRLKVEAKQMTNIAKKENLRHHELGTSILDKQQTNVKKLISTLESHVNPFEYDNSDVINLVTKAVMPNETKTDLCDIDSKGNKQFTLFTEERLKSNAVNFWAPLKKVSLKTWKDSVRKTNVKLGDKVVELKEDRGLFARMLIVANSRQDVNIEEVISTYELSVVPRSMFSADGQMNHCSDKSSLMKILETLPNKSTVQPFGEKAVATECQPNDFTVAIVDGMTVVQSLDKPNWIKTCKDLSNHFLSKLDTKFSHYKEVHIVFDRYDMEKSLKTATRVRRQASKQPIAFHVTDTTKIESIPLRDLLSHTSTKDELTVYLAAHVIEHARETGTSYVVASRDTANASNMNVNHLQSIQEEADTKMILHAVDAASRGAKTLHVYSLDTDVLVLCLRRFRDLPDDTHFITGTGQRKRSIKLLPIYEALGADLANALPGFHALSGADNTGSFSGKGKILCWKALQKSSVEIKKAFADLGSDLTNKTKQCIEAFVCNLYEPDTSITSVSNLRWWMFRRKQAESDKLPPTKAALEQAILRAHYQCIVWVNDMVPNPVLPNPVNYGWRMEDSSFVPVMTTLAPAPDAILMLVKCGCSKTKCTTARCKCKANKLVCTELCVCGSEEDACENTETHEVEGISLDDE